MPANPTRRCAGCLHRPFPFHCALAALAYGGALTQAILRFKHAGHRHLARPLGSWLGPALSVAAQRGIDVTVPVPLHPRRLRQRGFNQALELLRAGLHILPSDRRMPIACNALVRSRDTPMLGHASPAGRRQLLQGAFAITHPSAIVGKRVLVIDDVMTTGATLAECARVLLAAGASRVEVLALARAIG